MTVSRRIVAAILLSMVVVAPAASQQVPTGTNERTTVGAPLLYRSAFAGYQRFKEQPIEPWRASNDVVERIGGWRAYAQESQAAASSGAGTPTGEAASPARSEHGRHGQ